MWVGWGLTVLCGLLDASFILWGIWTQPHQVKPGQEEAAVVGRLSLAPSAPLVSLSSQNSPRGHHHLHVECHRDPGPGEGGPKGLRREKASVESLGMGRAALGGPSQQAGPVFQVLPGNLPRGAGGCGWGISG